MIRVRLCVSSEKLPSLIVPLFQAKSLPPGPKLQVDQLFWSRLSSIFRRSLVSALFAWTLDLCCSLTWALFSFLCADLCCLHRALQVTALACRPGSNSLPLCFSFLLHPKSFAAVILPLVLYCSPTVCCLVDLQCNNLSLIVLNLKVVNSMVSGP